MNGQLYFTGLTVNEVTIYPNLNYVGVEFQSPRFDVYFTREQLEEIWRLYQKEKLWRPYQKEKGDNRGT